MVRTSEGPGNYSLTWTPSDSDYGRSHPICFVVQAKSVRFAWTSHKKYSVKVFKCLDRQTSTVFTVISGLLTATYFTHFQHRVIQSCGKFMDFFLYSPNRRGGWCWQLNSTLRWIHCPPPPHVNPPRLFMAAAMTAWIVRLSPTPLAPAAVLPPSPLRSCASILGLFSCTMRRHYFNESKLIVFSTSWVLFFWQIGTVVFIHDVNHQVDYYYKYNL